MKQILISLMVLLPLLGAADRVVAGDDDGGYAGSFLQVPIGARPTAMGGAYRALSDDGAGALFNPAGIASIQKKIFATSYRTMSMGRKLGYATLLFPAAGQSALGVHWLYAGSGSVERRNYDGDPLGDELQLHNHDFSIIFAKRFESFMSIGIKMNYLAASFAEMKVYSVGIDGGIMLFLDQLGGRERDLTLPLEDMRVGLTVKYLDAKFSWNSEDYMLKYVGESTIGTEQQDLIPMEFGLGISGRLLDRKLVLATDLVKNTEQGVELHLGTEYFFSPEVAARAGYSNGRFSIGGGYLFKIGRQALAIDYAFSTDRVDEGTEHIFSFDLLF